MQFFRDYSKRVTGLMLLCFGLVTVYIPGAQAALVDTPALLAAEEERARIESFIARDDVREALIAHGVDPHQARTRIANLTDAEVRQMAAEIDALPAGGDAVGAAVFVFLVLLVTDIMGLTDLFPFVRKPEER